MGKPKTTHKITLDNAIGDYNTKEILRYLHGVFYIADMKAYTGENMTSVYKYLDRKGIKLEVEEGN